MLCQKMIFMGYETYRSITVLQVTMQILGSMTLFELSTCTYVTRVIQ